MNKYHWQTCGLTDTGKVRKRNEDNLFLDDRQKIWLVADGAGGHANGDLASLAVVDAFHDYQSSQRIGSDVRQVVTRLHKTNQYLIEQQVQSGQVSGSTVSVVVSDGRTLVCIWSGDSPIYRLRNNRLMRLIQDHNRVEDFIQQGFSAEECEAIPYAQYLTQAIGANEHLCVQTQWCEIRQGDCLIICSDGVTKELSDSRIGAIMRQYSVSAEAMSQALLTETLAKGARDNSTVISLLIK
jgi:protein phosphatase